VRLAQRRLLVSARRGVVLAVAVLLVVLVGTDQLMNARTFQVAGALVDRVETAERVVGLTFDDGPGPQTAELVGTLGALGVRATFVVTGAELRAHPERGRALVAAGHELGNHTYDHRRMVLVHPGTVAAQIETTDAAIRAAGHLGPIRFRPPGGKKLVALPRYLDARGTTTVMWDVEPDSGRHPGPAELVQAVLDQVRPGSIVLLHPWYDSGAATRAALPALVEGLRAQGYAIVTVEELLRRSPG
jgi:peptidoglycan-N-acetylglucosamine deacetylase